MVKLASYYQVRGLCTYRSTAICSRYTKLRHFSNQTIGNKSFNWLQEKDEYCNIGESIADKVGINLHQKKHHPLNIIKTKIENYFDTLHHEQGFPKFKFFDDLHPVVSTDDCFDLLLVPKDHVSRRQTDTYYVNPNTVLRSHTTAHEVPLLKQGHKCFLVTGDVYRRDEIDASHYPVFHQLEGVRVFSHEELDPTLPYEEKVQIVLNDLKNVLEGVVKTIFGDVEMRWLDDVFPFTDPSIQLEIYFNGDWLEVLGSGVLKPQILQNAGLDKLNAKDAELNLAWAFGLGLERLAMVLFQIPDIRLFWSSDPRFHSQFQDGQVTMFTPYSKYPGCYKDVSFWCPDDFHENNFCEIVRDVAGDVVEKVTLVDEFRHPSTNKESKCYRVMYRHMDRNLTNEEVDALQKKVREKIVSDLKVELR